MAVTESQVREYLGVAAGTDVASLLATAAAMLVAEVGTTVVPVAIVDNATLQLTSELHLRRSNPGGIVSFAGGESVARVTRDPMSSVRPLLAPWVVPF